MSINNAWKKLLETTPNILEDITRSTKYYKAHSTVSTYIPLLPQTDRKPGVLLSTAECCNGSQFVRRLHLVIKSPFTSCCVLS